jgi:RNA polymerase sigma-70 factor, ECF subfamily
MMSKEDFLTNVESRRHEYYSYLHRILIDASLVDDVFSDAVLSAYKSLGKFREGTNFRAWLYRILLNKAYVANRKTKREVPLDDAQADGLVAPAAKTQYAEFEDCREEMDDVVARAMDALRPIYRRCLHLRAMHGCSYEEIAERLRLPLGTVMTNLSRARIALRKRLQGYALARGVIT